MHGRRSCCRYVSTAAELSQRVAPCRLELQKKLSGKGGKGVRKIVVGGEKSPYEDEGGRVGGVTVYKWRKARAK